MAETCQNCRFSHFGGMNYQCRRFPPQVNVEVQYDPDPRAHSKRKASVNRTLHCNWPEVGNDMWCGEWAPKDGALQL